MNTTQTLHSINRQLEYCDSTGFTNVSWRQFMYPKKYTIHCFVGSKSMKDSSLNYDDNISLYYYLTFESFTSILYTLDIYILGTVRNYNSLQLKAL